MNLTRSAKPASERTSFERITTQRWRGLDADHGVGGLAVMAALVEAVALRAVEDDDAQARVQILALLARRQVGEEEGKLMGSGDVQLRLRHLGA